MRQFGPPNLSASDIPNLDASKITTGKIALARGGTNADLSSTGGTSQILKQSSAGGNITVGTITSTEAMAGFTGTKDNSVFMRGDGAMSNTFSGLLSVGGGATILESAGARKSTDVSGLTIAGGSAYTNSNGAMVDVRGNSNVSGPGEVRIYAGTSGSVRIFDTGGNNSVSFTGGEIRIPSGNTTAGSSSERWIGPRSGSTVSVFQNAPSTGSHGWGVNGSEAFRVDANGPRGDAFSPLTSSNAVLRTNTSAASDTLKAQMAAAGSVDPTRGAVNEVVGINATNEAGANIRRATGKLQAASTSANLVAVAATDCGHVGIIDNNTGGETARVNIKNGAITSITGDTTTYVTTSPTSAQCRLTISGGYLVGTTGSGWAYKAGTMPNLVRMV